MNNQDNPNKEELQTEENQQIQEQDIQDLQKDLEDMTNTAKRALADLKNFKRHAEEQRSTLMNMGQIDILTKIMPVYDNLARAISHTPEELQDNDWVNGIQSIKNQFLTLLKNSGLELLPGKGEPANPNQHEIITSTPGTPQNEIVEVLEQGYSFNGKVIKPSKVVVGSDN